MTTTNSNACASASIDMSAIPANVPSLCIPRVFANVTRERIAKVFEELDLGIIERIDLVSKIGRDNGDKFQRVFIHFRSWGGNSNAVKARERVLQGKEIKIIYDDPWFWKVSANRSHDSSSASAQAFKRPDVKKKISIDFDCDSSTPSRPVDNVKRPAYDNRPARDPRPAQGQGQGKSPYKKPITKLVIKKEENEPAPVTILKKEKVGEEGEIVEQTK